MSRYLLLNPVLGQGTPIERREPSASVPPELLPGLRRVGEKEIVQFDLEALKERDVCNNLGRRLRDYAVLGSCRIEPRTKLPRYPDAQQQFGGPDDSANQGPRRSNSERFKEPNRS